MKILLIILILLFSSNTYSQEFALDQILTEDGKKLSVEFIEYCRDTRGRFKVCEGEDAKEKSKRCRDVKTGRFFKCPD
jgi:hypothetical protein